MKSKSSLGINAIFRLKSLTGTKKDQLEPNLPKLGNGLEKKTWVNCKLYTNLFKENMN